MDNSKKMHRNTQNKVIAGVCSGLADFFGIDVALVRLLFIVLLLAGCSGFLIYLILWIVMPSTNSTQSQNDGNSQAVAQRTGKGGWIAGTILIVIGFLCLFDNLFPQFNWTAYWPVLLIMLGLLLIVPFKNKKS